MKEPDAGKLFESLLQLDSAQDERRWEVLSNLWNLDSAAAFDRAVGWCRSQDSQRRRLGADILSQFGVSRGKPIPSFADESFAIISTMIAQERHADALGSEIVALGNLGSVLCVPVIARCATHEEADVRMAVAFALGQFPNECASVETLLYLMNDKASAVRDWATFGLGVQSNADSPQIRAALARRAEDEDDEVRMEAIVGLARRRDRRAVLPLLKALGAQSVLPGYLDAMEFLLDLDVRSEGTRVEECLAALCA